MARSKMKEAKQKAGSTEKGIKKIIWFQKDEAAALCVRAFEERRSRLLGIKD